MNRPRNLDSLCWPTGQLTDCLAALLKASGIATGSDDKLPSPPLEAFEVDEWLCDAATRLACDLETVTCSSASLEDELDGCGVALLRIKEGFFAIIGERRGRMQVVRPDGKTVSVSTPEMCHQIRVSADQTGESDLQRILTDCGLPESRRRRALVLANRTGGRWPIVSGWRFRAGNGASIPAWLRQVSAVRNSVLLILAHSAAYGFWLLSWSLLGSESLSGHLDAGWLRGWSLLLATYVALRILSSWFQGRLAIGVAGILKRRLLAGVLKLDPQELRRQGIGSFLGQTFEAEALETLVLGGGVTGLLAGLDLLLSAFVLGRAAILLGAFLGLVCFLSWRFLLKYNRWTSNRMALTQDLVESMVGHRTRLAQQPSSKWHESEDRALVNYFDHSKEIDRIGAILLALVPRGWLLASLGYLSTFIISGKSSSAEIAVLLGGILLSWSAFERLVGASSEIMAAFIACRRVSHIFRAASRPDLAGTVPAATVEDFPADRPIIEADRISFKHAEKANPVLDGCGLQICRSERILLEGPSGGGKTTFASLLAGIRQPESGLILAGGLDMQTLGRDGWRKYVVLVPQFHENYLFAETLAFNLLCARRWPATSADLADADEVCRGLGLSDLLDRMPAGIMQMVGEGGWQLSHGERSRVFIARALLQKPALMILDESFGALDPDNLRRSLGFTLERANSVMVIAHP